MSTEDNNYINSKRISYDTNFHNCNDPERTTYNKIRWYNRLVLDDNLPISYDDMTINKKASDCYGSRE